MSWQFTPYMLFPLASAWVSSTLAAYLWRQRSRSGARSLFWLMIAITIWTFSYSLQLSGSDLETMLFWAKIKYFGIATVPLAWLLFILDYTDRWRQFLATRWRLLLFIEPLVTIVLALTIEQNGLIYRDIYLDTAPPYLSLGNANGAWFWIHAAFSYAYIWTGLVILFSSLSALTLYRRQMVILAIGSLVPVLLNSWNLLGLNPLPKFDPTPSAFALGGLLIALSMFRSGFFDMLPIARQAVWKNMKDAMLVLDTNNRVIDINPAGWEIFINLQTDPTRQNLDLAGQIIADFVRQHPDVLSKRTEITLGQSDYDLRVSPLHNRDGQLAGYLFVARDITARKAAEKALRQAKEELESAYHRLENEQEKAERLLLNILPRPVAERLKQHEETIADDFADVSVMFADIVNFTRLSARYEPTELVHLLNRVFSRFDELAETYGLEKIKTVGDAYMAVGGLPTPRSDHLPAMVEMALAMQETISSFKIDDGRSLSMRIGIHAGPVVAGVIGRKKFSYDLWGDTVNMASRMESHGRAGSIQVSQATYEQLQGSYAFQRRGTVNIKGKGPMTTYFLTGRTTGGQ